MIMNLRMRGSHHLCWEIKIEYMISGQNLQVEKNTSQKHCIKKHYPPGNHHAGHL